MTPEECRKLGGIGWVVLAAYVVAWDHYCPDALSHAFLRASRHPYGRPVVIAVWGVTTCHLFGLIPKRYDPFEMAYHHVRR